MGAYVPACLCLCVVCGDLSRSYEVLGVDNDATEREIKKAFRTLSVKFHPDKVRASGVDEDEAKKKYELIQQVS